MLQLNQEIEKEGLLHAAELICLAARTAPKAKGLDLVVTALVTGSEKDQLTEKMKEIGERDGLGFFSRDAGNIDSVDVVILLGSKKKPLGLNCKYCGFDDCAAMVSAGSICAFNTGDLGIAVGSAVSRAADLRLDNRIMYSAGKAAVELGFLGDEVQVAYAIPLSATGKSPFFDRG